MQFAKLRLSGFKSFVDPAELVIQPGLTGIVGPNGCGKSNLVEALRWAMGENSAKRMRGGEMDDVIFGGTSARPARNVAEVALSLDNPGRAAPKPYDEIPEIEVLRRIERGIGSDFRINGHEVRARDVQLLFADAASGAHSAALVSQGRVSAIIAARPAERRALLEEASGITGLHSRRHEAELRLKAAEANLTRLDDVLRALEAQLDGLRKQARQAGRYRRLSEHIRRAEAVVLHLRWRHATAEHEAASARLGAAEIAVADRTAVSLALARKREAAQDALPALRQSEVAAGAELQRLVIARQALEEEEHRIAARRKSAVARLDQMASDIAREEELAADARAALERLEAEREVVLAAQAQEGAARETAEAALAALEEEVAARETERTLLTEQIAADEAQRAALTRRLDEAAERAARLAERQTEMSREAAAIEAEKVAASVAAEATSALREAEAEVARAAAASEAAAEALAQAQADEDAARAPKDAAETALTKLNAERQALAELLAAMGDKRYSPVLDSLTVESGFETALGAALGDDLTAPLDTAAPAHWFALPNYSVAQALPAGTTLLAAHVTAPAALARRLAQIGVVADREIGEMLQTQLLPGQRLVSRDGGLWRWDGFRRAAGTPTAAAQRLRQRNRIAEIEGILDAAEVELAGPRRRARRRARQGAAAGGGGARRARDRASDARDSCRRARPRGRSGPGGGGHRLAARGAGRGRRAPRARPRRDPIDRARGRRGAGEPPRFHARARGRCRLAQSSRRAPRGAAATSERARGAAARGGKPPRARRRDRERARTHGAGAPKPPPSNMPPSSLGATISTARSRNCSASRPRSRRGASASPKPSPNRRRGATTPPTPWPRARPGWPRPRRKRRPPMPSSGSRAKSASAPRARATKRRDAQEALARHIEERLECAPEQALATVGIAGAEELPSQEDAQSRFDRLVRERDNMGPVNLVAESEAAEIEERLAGLVHEREDLTGAIARLRQGIAALNREGRERLLAAFAQVNEHFTKLFVQLFGGGRAYLSLDRAEGETEGATGDPLEAGLEIMASPPGKKLQALSLLSGGEQALDRARLAVRRVPHQPGADLRPRRGRRAVGRRQCRPLLPPRRRDRADRRDPLPHHHPSPADHVAGRSALRRDHGRARRVATGLGRSPERRATPPRGVRRGAPRHLMTAISAPISSLLQARSAVTAGAFRDKASARQARSPRDRPAGLVAFHNNAAPSA